MSNLCDGQLQLYSNVNATEIEWLWYPYIPMGKITLLQGDPGSGKSTLMMNVIAAASTGSQMPDGSKQKKAFHVIYQCSEDDVSDTIKPRLKAAGAECRNVAFVNEETVFLTLDDEMLRRAIADFNAKLIVIDPVQAYVGDADLSNASGMRKKLRQLAVWASLYNCAIVLIGHLNKRQGNKDIYRSLGSIDLIAAARSVIQIEAGEMLSDPNVMRHVKSSLAPKGEDRFFIIDRSRTIRWVESQLTPAQSEFAKRKREPKQQRAIDILRAELSSGPKKVSELHQKAGENGIGDKTLTVAKTKIGARSVRKDGTWFWQMPDGKELQEGI